MEGQVLIGDSIENITQSAILELKSTTKGLLPPRMTMEQRDAIINPTPGLIIYCTDCLELQLFNDTAWTNMIGQPAALGFQCGDPLRIQGQNYATVQIGSQCWMAENLNVGVQVSGTNFQSDNKLVEKVCYYNDQTYCDIYGGLYLWGEAMQYQIAEGAQGICPEGWHIPTDQEIKILELEVGLPEEFIDSTGFRGGDEGSKLAARADLWYSGNLELNPNFGTSGFDLIPAGYFYYSNTNATFDLITAIAEFWSSSKEGDEVWTRYLLWSRPMISRQLRYDTPAELGYSVRCLQN